LREPHPDPQTAAKAIALLTGKPMAPTEVLSVLRRETHAAHQRLEAGLDLLGPALTCATYRCLLERFWGFCVPAEPRVAATGAWQALGLDGTQRGKVVRLEADLLALGHGHSSLARLPLCTEVPCLDTVPRALGYLYVFEGSTLGGALILRHLHRTLGLSRARGASFFGSYGSEVGPMWKAFTHALGTYAAQAHEERQIVEAACETFSSLERWLLPSQT
jgi:heme oxygenase (biliverdin-IX-beta and delta-forming)